jgi:hypothetical protein
MLAILLQQRAWFSPLLRSCFFFLVMGALAAWPNAAYAGELQAEIGGSAHASTWRSDYGGGGYLKLGYRTKIRLGFDVGFAERLSSVDTRFNGGLSIGLHLAPRIGSLVPLLRAYFIHQHEQGAVSVAKDPLTMVVGIGDGIRHRAGFGFSLGTEIPLAKAGSTTWYAAPSATIDVFPNRELGPLLYAHLSLGLGATFDVTGLP